MVIRCKNCDFKLRASGEGFALRPTEINFCPQCGLRYREHGNDVEALFLVQSNWQKWMSKIYKLYILLPMFSAILAFLFVPLVFTKLPEPEMVIVALLIFMGYMVATVFTLERTAKKKFPEVYNGNQ